MMKLLIFFAVLTVCVAAKCPFPPRLWCSSVAVARQCGVEEQCFPQKAKPTSIDLYYETLCPGCRIFIASQLYPTWEKVPQLINITLVPYGNAQERKQGDKWVFECQHGPEECKGNLIETCAMHILKDIKDYFPFINCMETGQSEDMDTVARGCATKLKIDYTKIDACTKSSAGNNLQHEMAVKTGNLKPPHEYTPWIVVNGEHNQKLQEEAQSDLLKLVCDMWKGAKPAACNGTKRNVCVRN